MKKNALFSSLGYVPSVVKPVNKIRIRKKKKINWVSFNAYKELAIEKEKRRKLYETDRDAWAKYKLETKDKIRELAKLADQSGK